MRGLRRWGCDMHALHAGRNQAAVGWVSGTVHPLLCTPNQVRAAIAAGAGCHAGRRDAQDGFAKPGRDFAGTEGHGCALSHAELALWHRVQAEPMSWEA